MSDSSCLPSDHQFQFILPLLQWIPYLRYPFRIFISSFNALIHLQTFCLYHRELIKQRTFICPLQLYHMFYCLHDFYEKYLYLFHKTYTSLKRKAPLPWASSKSKKGFNILLVALDLSFVKWKAHAFFVSTKGIGSYQNLFFYNLNNRFKEHVWLTAPPLQEQYTTGTS